MLNYGTGSITEISRLVWAAHSCPTLKCKSSLEREVKTKSGLSNVISILICLSASLITFACNQSSQPTVKSAPQVASVKRYHLKGKVVSIDERAKMVNIDSETIPGFMDAMTMPYKLKPESELDKVHPGDAIAADLLVEDDGAWLENVEVTAHSSPPNSK